MSWTADDIVAAQSAAERRASAWPIGAALLQFPSTLSDGSPVMDAPANEWVRQLAELRLAGFDHVDLTDSWLRPGDLSPTRLRELSSALADASLAVSAVSVTRRSVIDPRTGEANLAYAHRTIDAVAALGATVLCLGLHRPLTLAQRDALWFWLAPGDGDPVDDEATYRRAVAAFQELGHHAADHGVALSLEMYEDTYLGTADDCVRMIEDIGLANVGINPDVGNIIRLHRPVEPWQDQFAKLLPVTNYWHIKNYTRDHDPATGAYATNPAPLEFGVINYRQVIGEALELGFDGPFCVEHYGGDGISVSAKNRDYIRAILATKMALREA